MRTALSALTLFASFSLLDAAPPRQTAPVPPLALVSPEAAGMSRERLARIDAIVEDAIAKKEIPGAVILVGRHGKVVFRKAYGFRALLPAKEPMTADTVFDLASLTKPVATATSVMQLIEDGKVRLADRVTAFLPGFASGGGEREQVTIEQLLTHRAGLPPDDPMDIYSGTRAEIFARKFKQPLTNSPGSRFVYSDASFEYLAEVVREVTGLPLDEYSAKRIFEPLGMRDTEFRPLGKGGRVPVARIAPTEKRAIPGSSEYLRGEVHDPRAFALGGVAGHAGLFGTADDLARYCRALLSGGGPILSPAGVAAMTRARSYGDRDLRALGWDVATGFSSNRGDLFPVGSYGHTGWTGTSIWIDPVTDAFVIVLSNRNHPDGAGNAVPLRAKVASAAAAALTDVTAELINTASEAALQLAASGSVRATGGPQPAAAGPRFGDVKAGVDVLEKQGFQPIAGKRVALLTNQTGLTRDGRTTIDVLASEKAKAAGVTLARLFSPEHGPRGEKDEKVADSVDPKTSLPIRSLYGDSRRVSPEDLAGVDVVVVDLQDAGARFYTYLTTLGTLMEDAAKANVKVVVLDRPNPIRADRLEGPPADPEQLSFTAYHTIPVRTGMTIGELARLFDAERKIGADLTVVKLEGYRRDLWYDETGLRWIPPSPNLRTPTQAALYPGVALLETTNVSVGRGTDTPFEVVGAPWMDGPALAATLNARAIAGVRFTPVRFTPASSVHAGKDCDGVRISLVNRDALDAVRLGLELATALRDLHAKDWDSSKLGRLLASNAALARFQRGENAASIATGWAADLMEFERRRAAFLLY